MNFSCQLYEKLTGERVFLLKRPRRSRAPVSRKNLPLI